MLYESVRFTERARKVLELAEREAKALNHMYIGTEHLLLGLLRENDGVAARVLTLHGLNLESLHTTVIHIVGRGDKIVFGEIGLTPRTRKVIELAEIEALKVRHRYVGTEHLLLGIIEEGDGIAAGVLSYLGVNLEDLRHHVTEALKSPYRAYDSAES